MFIVANEEHTVNVSLRTIDRFITIDKLFRDAVWGVDSSLFATASASLISAMVEFLLTRRTMPSEWLYLELSFLHNVF